MRKETALKYFENMSDAMRARIDDGIEQYRKGDASVTATLDGVAVPDGTAVDIEQVNHEFRFGANLFMLDEMETEEKNRLYKQKFAELFNIATLPFYWKDLEPTDGQLRFAADSPKIYRRPAPDLCLAYCREHGIEPKLHCLNYDRTSPDWIAGASVDEVKARLSRRFREIAERYADSIPSIEVTNETLPAEHKTKFFTEDDFVEWSFREADKYFPNNRLIINDYVIYSPHLLCNRSSYYMQIERLMREGITHIDSVGLQFHSFFSKDSEANFANTRYNPEFLYQLMDCYAKLGLKEQITEMTIPAYSGDAEDEEVQAELLVHLYRTFFSHPSMEAVIYWNLVEGYAGAAERGDMTQGENVFWGGLLRFDMSEKPAFQRLKKLINEEWHTSVSTQVRNGSVDFRGFFGDYQITYHLPTGDGITKYQHTSKR